MRFPLFLFGGAIISGLAAANACAQPVSLLSAAAAERMAAACIAYAKARDAAVNVWIFDSAGVMLHFQRMDGAPPVGALPDGGRSRSGMMGGRFDDPSAFNAEAPGAVPVMRDGQRIGTTRAAGMGAIGDRACAQAAAAAGTAAPAGGGGR